MDKVSSAHEYNSTSFPLDMDMASFKGFRDGAPGPGETAPDGELTNAMTGERVKLSDLSKQGHQVIEFGSIT